MVIAGASRIAHNPNRMRTDGCEGGRLAPEALMTGKADFSDEEWKAVEDGVAVSPAEQAAIDEVSGALGASNPE
jgi:hypothetical protein